MSWGVEVHRSIFLTNWTEENVVRKATTKRRMAAPYRRNDGGTQDTVGHTVLYPARFDGVPDGAFTYSRDRRVDIACRKQAEDIPVITFFDEQRRGGLRTHWKPL